MNNDIIDAIDHHSRETHTVGTLALKSRVETDTSHKVKVVEEKVD
jgi:hypothetical protein